jgi:hypothetical protein
MHAADLPIRHTATLLSSLHCSLPLHSLKISRTAAIKKLQADVAEHIHAGVDMNNRYPLQNMAEVQTQDEPLTLTAMWKMVSRRRWAVTAILLTVVGATVA